MEVCIPLISTLLSFCSFNAYLFQRKISAFTLFNSFSIADFDEDLNNGKWCKNDTTNSISLILNTKLPDELDKLWELSISLFSLS